MALFKHCVVVHSESNFSLLLECIDVYRFMVIKSVKCLVVYKCDLYMFTGDWMVSVESCQDGSMDSSQGIWEGAISLVEVVAQKEERKR